MDGAVSPAPCVFPTRYVAAVLADGVSSGLVTLATGNRAPHSEQNLPNGAFVPHSEQKVMLLVRFRAEQLHSELKKWKEDRALG